MEFLAALLVFGGFWFWVFSGIFFFVIMAFAENEKNVLAFLALTFFVIIMEWTDTLNIISTAITHPWFAIKWIAVYFVAGSIWSVIKWFTYVRNRADEFGQLKLKYLEKVNKNGEARDGEDWEEISVALNTPIPERSKSDFTDFLERERYLTYNKSNIVPTASANKDRIVTWIIWWPTSLLWTLINDPIRKLAEKLYAALQGIYSKISQQAFKKFDV